MAYKQVKLKAAPPTPDDEGDKSLPDASPEALGVLAAGIVIALVAALAMNSLGFTGKEFKPPSNADFSFALFAGFYAAAQIIERLMEFVTPFLPVAEPKTEDTAAVKAAQAKADRAKSALAVAAIAGVVVANAFGLFFLKTIGIDASHTIDSLCTGLLIAAGTKPLHDFITLLQAQTTPKTKTITTTKPAA